MDNIKNDRYYIKKILENANAIVEGMTDISKEAFDENNILQAAMMFS